MHTKKVRFSDVKEGHRFQYDGDLFVKTGVKLAWDIRGGRRYKEWAFLGDEFVTLIIL